MLPSYTESTLGPIFFIKPASNTKSTLCSYKTSHMEVSKTSGFLLVVSLKEITSIFLSFALVSAFALGLLLITT